MRERYPVVTESMLNTGYPMTMFTHLRMTRKCRLNMHATYPVKVNNTILASVSDSVFFSRNKVADSWREAERVFRTAKLSVELKELSP